MKRMILFVLLVVMSSSIACQRDDPITVSGEVLAVHYYGVQDYTEILINGYHAISLEGYYPVVVGSKVTVTAQRQWGNSLYDVSKFSVVDKWSGGAD